MGRVRSRGACLGCRHVIATHQISIRKKGEHMVQEICADIELGK